MTEKRLYKGVVKSIVRDNKGDIKWVDLENLYGQKYKLFADEMDSNMKSKIRYNQIIDFVILRDNIVSSKRAMNLKRNNVIRNLKSAKQCSGEIKELYPWGALLSVEGVYCMLTNAEFSKDCTTIKDIYNVGDVITGLTFKKISSLEYIHISCEEKYTGDVSLDYSYFKPGNLLCGVVKSIKPTNNKEFFSCFVGVPGDRDILTPMPSFEIVEGDRVVCKLNKVDEKENILKGNVIKLIG